MPCTACGTSAMTYVRQYHMNKNKTYNMINTKNYNTKKKTNYKNNNKNWGMCFYYRR